MSAPTSSRPHLMEQSHDDGSAAAIRIFFTFIAIWEALYHLARLATNTCLARSPEKILDSTLFNAKEHDNNNKMNNGNMARAKQTSPLENAKQTLRRRGPSYLVSLIHSVCVTCRGIMHLYNLWHGNTADKLLVQRKGMPGSYRWAHLQVTTTNTMFVAYLTYDLFHIILQYPKLGGLDTIMHHLVFAACSFINGTYGILPFQFGWLIAGELSTIFLNTRWFMLKSGRENSPLLGRVNELFAATFFLTRIGMYSAGMIHLFCFSMPELKSLPEISGVPISLLGMTCGCMTLGWILNMLWGYKILALVRGGAKKMKPQ
mmetsp:Transcript_5206/g.11395  ORF Transcript_5206/g.11395 Transcript_5206/m.11395 type:complete len:317 (+) Transcript_5206:42-992(+)